MGLAGVAGDSVDAAGLDVVFDGVFVDADFDVRPVPVDLAREEDAAEVDPRDRLRFALDAAAVGAAGGGAAAC